ncbi:MAG: hypothetical protein AB7H90_16315 [Alphaproteobacteria bacterium]
MAFDTLTYARKLKAAGMPDAQAEAVAEATRDILTTEAATKADITGLKHDIENVRHEIEIVRREVAEMGLRVTVRLGALIAVGVGILAALIKL